VERGGALLDPDLRHQLRRGCRDRNPDGVPVRDQLGAVAFFLESSFLSLLVWGEKRLSRIGHFLAAAALFAGSWLSGYFITATNAFMQHPAGHTIDPNGDLLLSDF
jgi:hypothetical protein